MGEDKVFIEDEVGAPEELETARSALDDFYNNLQVPEGQNQIYEEAREAELEFETALIHSLYSPDATDYIHYRIKGMKEEVGTPRDALEDLENRDQELKEYSMEQLEEAEEYFDLLFNKLRTLADGLGGPTLNAAEENYEHVLDYAEEQIQDRPNIEPELDKEIIRHRQGVYL